MITIQKFKKMKKYEEKISMITCYDYTSAKIINETDIDLVLVGDSAAMVMHGHDTTIPATVEMMTSHIEAVKRGIDKKIIIADMPFLAHRNDISSVIKSVDRLMKAGANAIKIEGGIANAKIIQHIVESGVPVMGHLGLMPQSVHSIGGWKVQGETELNADQIKVDSEALEDAGIFGLVLEMVPSELAKKITLKLKIPTIGIGAGVHTSGQVLVFQDLLGLNPQFNPTFLRKYLDGFSMFKESINQFCKDVKSENFPNNKESF
mgnify:CR=1 FL=1|tara:strand:- start:52427 stop:53215 length:789 start_codon:yes stop_codon:yes gene_type:complete